MQVKNMIYYNDNEEYCCRVLRARIADGRLPPGTVDNRSIKDVPTEELKQYKQIHLFAGIGGFPLALEWINFGPDRGIITGGFPCQDISTAGKGAGLEGDRSGLWWETLAAISVVRPEFIILENVSALLTRGLDVVLGSLASLGYYVEWHCVPASHVGAPHRRDRIWIVGVRGDVADTVSDGDSESIGRVDAQEGGLPGEHRAEDSSAGKPSGTGSIRETNNEHEDMADTEVTPNNGKPENNSRTGATGKGKSRGRGRQTNVADTNGGGCHSIPHPKRTLPETKEKKSRKPQAGRASQATDHSNSRPPNVADAGSIRCDAGRAEQSLQGPGTYGKTQPKKDVADADDNGTGWGEQQQSSGEGSGLLADTECERSQGERPHTDQERRQRSVVRPTRLRHGAGDGQGGWGAQCRLGIHPDGLQSGLDNDCGGWECGVPRVTRGQKDRAKRLKALGNAIVPQCAAYVLNHVLRSAKNDKR